VEALTEPNQMVKDYLNELNIRCVYNNRGCKEIQLEVAKSTITTPGSARGYMWIYTSRLYKPRLWCNFKPA
jgi:hypothetical protein